MSNYLINQALQHIWCAPRMDLQSIVRPKRICGKEGVWNKAKILWATYKLPTQGERYYIYQVGRLHPSLMGLLNKENRWITFSESCMQDNLFVDIYNDKGIQLPRFQCYYMVTADGNLVICVKEQKKIAINLRDEFPFIRVYSNAYYNAQRYNPNKNIIQVFGGIPRNNNEILALQQQYENLLGQPGAVWCYVNGYLTDSISFLTVHVDDVVEFIYDASVKKIVQYPVSSLRTFDSLLDKNRKYLLHYAGVGPTDIDYFDDIDFYLVKPGKGAAFNGVMIHRNAEDAIRMVTHRDYSLKVDLVKVLANYQANWNDTSQLVVMAFIRQGGWNRTLVPENNRTEELYKLQDSDIRDAMLGVNSQVSVWRADNLENSPYTQIMRTDNMLLDKMTVEEAYGYNAIACMVGKTPLPFQIVSDQKIIRVPYGLQKYSSVFEYDAAGYLLGHANHVSGTTYVSGYKLAQWAEQLVGLADDRIDEVYGDMNVTLAAGVEYRMYTCDIIDGVPKNNWKDVTGSGLYAINGTTLSWGIDPKYTYPLVRGNSMILYYESTVSVVEGILSFTLSQRVLRNGVIGIQAMQIPMATLEIFLNGRKLIENLDYFVQFPKVVIVNKKYLTDTTKPQNLAVRWTGFCDSNMNREAPTDFGFVSQGVLSRNGRYDLRDDRIQHISVDGLMYDKSELKFAENGIVVDPTDALNGAPYSIQDIFVPFREITLEKTLAMRDASRVIDKEISDYMTLKVPEQKVDAPNVIPNLYPVYSPFIGQILADLKAGLLDDPRLKQHYNTELVRELCKPYEWLLSYDPAVPALRPDPNYVTVHPHIWTTVQSINIYQMKFLKMVVDYYLPGALDLSRFVNISS